MPKCPICKEKYQYKYNSLTEPTCGKDECIFQFRELQKSKPKKEVKKYVIPKVSENKNLQDIIYRSERIKFLMLPENKVCPITGKEATTIHHKKGRLGDLYLDKKYWIALSMEGHEFVEKNPKWAEENGYRLSRLAK